MLILADDLSGAADCGVACVSAGLEALVALRHTDEDDAADVLSLDADTRRMSADSAAEVVDRLVRIYAANPDLLLFKKIDSTLRGNVGPELAAALHALRGVRAQSHSVAIMAPAFPAIGRTTRNGTQFVHGQPLHDLDIWRVQGMAGLAHIPEMLQHAGLKCSVLDLKTIRRPREPLANRMRAAADDGADVLICDAETDENLLAIATASMQLECRPLWVGSAGLAYQLPHAAGIAKAVSVRSVSSPPISGPLLFVIGSLSRNSLEQVRLLASFSSTLTISIPPDVLLRGEQHADWQLHTRELECAIRTNQGVVLSPKTEPRIDLAQRPFIAAALARVASSVAGEIGALVASGGETARAVFNSMGITRLRLLGELERGIPISITENWNRPLPVITKAGDFGGTDTLLKCSRFLRSEESRFPSPAKQER